MKRVSSFFASEKTPRWQLLLGGFAVVLFNFFQNEVYYQRALADSEAAAAQQRIEAKVIEIQQHSIDFQTYAGAFVSSILDQTGDTGARRDALVANILAQDAAVDVAASTLGPDTIGQVSQYRAALRRMKDAVEATSDVVSMSSFWSSASDLLVARNELLLVLEERLHKTGS